MNRFEQLLAPVFAGTLVLVTLIGVIGTALRDPRPHDIAIAISAPAPVQQQLTQAFAANAPGAFTFKPVDGEAAARAALDAREAVAALMITPGGPRLVIAGAAGDAVTGAASGALTAAFRAQGATLTTETVHPFAVGDAHGVLLFFLVFATLLSSVIAGALAGMRAEDWRSATASVLLFAVAAGVIGPLTVAWIAGGYGDGIWQVVWITALLSLAVASVTVGLARVSGAPGVALSAVILVLLGVIAAGGPLGSELLPDAYRAIAPWLPAAPAYSAVRGALYFGGVGVAGPAALLAGYALVGVALTALMRGRKGRAPGMVPVTA